MYAKIDVGVDFIQYGAMSLAIPELSLIQMARTLAPKPEEAEEKPSPPGSYRESLAGFDSGAHKMNGYMPPASLICKGIFPALQYVVKQHIYAINVAESLKSKSFERNKRVSVAERPNAWENPVTHPLEYVPLQSCSPHIAGAHSNVLIFRQPMGEYRFFLQAVSKGT